MTPSLINNIPLGTKEASRTTSADAGQIIDWRIFGVVAALGLGQSFLLVVEFPLSRLIASSASAFASAGLFQLNMAFIAYSFLITPFLLFLALYLLFSKQFMNRTTTLLISIIIGSVLGRWIGTILGIIAVPLMTPGTTVQPFAGSIAFYSGEDILVGFLAVAARHLNQEWDDRISKAGMPLAKTRPEAVLVTSILYIIFGILTLSLIPLLLLPDLSSLPVLVLLVILPIPLINGLVQILIGYGLLHGRRWGWILALFGALIGTVSNFGLTYSLLASAAWTYLLGIVLILVSITSLALSLLILFLLLTRQSRLYCRMVNPPTYASQPTA